MPTAPRHPCPTCGRLTHGTHCARHRRASAPARGYDDDWTRLARAWLASYPWCGQRLGGVFANEHSACARRGQHVRARVVDHIRPLRDGGARLDPFNLQSLCVRCNTQKG